MSSPPSSIHATAVAISLEGSKAKLDWGELHVGSHSYKLIEYDGTLHQGFPGVLDLSPSTRITLHYKTAGFKMNLWKKTHEINTLQLFANFSANRTHDVHDGIRAIFTCRTETVEGVLPTTDTDGTLPSTMDGILKDCPQFRILVIGKTGVGKSTLIRTVFGIDDAYSSNFVRGNADINVGLQSTVNKRFILHDSLGFERAENVNYDTVKEFIRNRRTGPLKDRLHAIWFCVPIPRAGARLLEAAAENFFKTKKKTMGTIPLIVVYTMLDLCVNDRMLEVTTPHPESDREKHAISEVESHAKRSNDEIGKLARESLPYAVVSTKEKYKYTLQKLIRLTYDGVGIHDTPETQIPTGATLIAAQRVDPNLKIKGTIDVGKQRYWKALRASPAFQGHTIWDCLHVIHKDVVAVWNFNDPAHHLSDTVFRELIVKMAQEVETRPVSNPTTNIFTLSGGSLVAVVTGILGATANPAAPIVLPILAGVLVGTWVYGVYRNAKIVQQMFIAYIVDLTHVMETLSILTSHKHKKLTRRTIKIAYDVYYKSNVRTQAHADIQDYRDLDGRDAALEKIESLIKPEQCGDANVKEYYARISELDLGRFNLDQEEEWSDQVIVLQ